MLLVYSELGLMSIPTVMLLLLLLLLLSNSPADPQLLMSNTLAVEISGIPPMTAIERELMSIPTVMLLLSKSPAGPQLLLSNTPPGEVAANPPMTAVERKNYTTTITSRQRPFLNNFPHLGNTAASDQFLFDLCIAGCLQHVSPRFLVISPELLTMDRNQNVTVLAANHVDRAGGI